MIADSLVRSVLFVCFGLACVLFNQAPSEHAVLGVLMIAIIALVLRVAIRS